MSHPIDIVKVLPTGKRVYRTVSEDEFKTGGWVEQGWAASDPYAPEINEDAYRNYDNREFQKLIQGKSTTELRDYMVPITVIKRLPTGKWASLRMFKGEYLTKGWANNGWIPRATQTRQWGPRAQYGRKKVLQDLKQQRWWRPRRSEAYLDGLFDYHGRPGLPTMDINLLRNPEYTINPRWVTYNRRFANYAEKHPTWQPFLALPNLTDEEKEEYWRTLRTYFERDKKTKAPPQIIPYSKLSSATRKHTKKYRW